MLEEVKETRAAAKAKQPELKPQIPITADYWPAVRNQGNMLCSLGIIDDVIPASTSGLNWYCNKKEGNNPMNYATATVQAGTTETQDQRKYLTQRLEEIFWELQRPLEAKFGLTDDKAPTTPKELKERIASGKFTIIGLPKDGDDEDEYDDDYFGCYTSWHRLLKWRDPSKKSDFEGFEAANKELRDLRQKTLDIIKIDEPKAGLDAIKALEAWKPTGAAN
jgi:hypothetical protein